MTAGKWWQNQHMIKAQGLDDMVTRNIPRFVTLALLGLIAACAPKPAPVVVVAPPPPPVIVIPAVPVPPLYAASNFVTPPYGVDGRRITPNTGINETETIWHMRSALNVAALNCVTAQYLPITDNYNLFLDTHKKALNKANIAIEAKFRKEHGSDYRRIRDTHSTQVYNFFSLPPVKQEFCDVALAVSQQLALTPTDQLEVFAFGGLRQMEDVFERFFAAYDQYQRDLYAWYVEYAPERASAFAPANQGGNGYATGIDTAIPAMGNMESTGPILTTQLPASDTSVVTVSGDSYNGYTPSAMATGDVMQPMAQPSIMPSASGAMVQPLPGESAPTPSGAVVQRVPGEIVQPLPGQAVPANTRPGDVVQRVPGEVVQPLPGQTPAPVPAPAEPIATDVWVTATGDMVDEAQPADQPPPR